MSEKRQYFLCGIGGSGMLPLALILRAAGHAVSGSDRALDQGRTAPKFDFLKSRGIALFPQDGAGLSSARQIVVASAAVEDTVPDIRAALELGAKRLSRAQMLSELFNAARTPIGVAGTSGKSTTTGMIAWILHAAGADPTVMNGAVMKNFASPDALFASALVGAGDAFVSEIDESDGSIALFSPKIAVLNNISLDHKSMEELRRLFSDFIAKTSVAILNLDNAETRSLSSIHRGKKITFSLTDQSADLFADQICAERYGVSFTAHDNARSEQYGVELKMPGRHNVANALAAIGAATAAGISFKSACDALCTFEGVKRRFEYIGEAAGISVIDDFGHNPDKISATLRTLKDFPGRLLVMFQPHGFGPLKKMKDEFIECFSTNLDTDDILVMPEPVYFGGTADRSVSSGDITAGVTRRGRKAASYDTRQECGDALVRAAHTGDRIVVMGARDDTLTTFAEGLLDQLKRLDSD
ncbi:MAG: Mur ligase family protein [Parvularculaceae bacterium]